MGLVEEVTGREHRLDVHGRRVRVFEGGEGRPLLVVDVQHDSCAPDGAFGRRGLRLHNARTCFGRVLGSTSIVQRWRPSAG